MKTLFAVLLAGLAAMAHAAPRAESATECGIAADMAVVARSLAQEEIVRPQAGAIMATCNVGGKSVQGFARVRVLPALPWQSSFGRRTGPAPRRP